jgi:hypothetical protein
MPGPLPSFVLGHWRDDTPVEELEGAKRGVRRVRPSVSVAIRRAAAAKEEEQQLRRKEGREEML